MHLADILKCVALDDDNSESPWNDLPIFFNFKDPIKYSEFRPILVDIIRKACLCVSNLLRDSQENAKKINSPQVYYVIKNLFTQIVCQPTQHCKHALLYSEGQFFGHR